MSDLWGTHAAGWAEHERQYRPFYEQALDLLDASGHVLDVGCGAGTFLRTAADRGLRVSGLDASKPLLELAREHVPEADLALGDLQALPHADGTFDAVTSFTSFWFAADPVEALREAGRVVRPGGPVLVVVHGRPEASDLRVAMDAVAALLDRPPPTLHEPTTLEAQLRAAGLAPRRAGTIAGTLEFADAAALTRQLRAPAAMVAAARVVGEARVATTLRKSLAPFRTPAGGYRLAHEWRYVIASDASPSTA